MADTDANPHILKLPNELLTMILEEAAEPTLKPTPPALNAFGHRLRRQERIQNCVHFTRVCKRFNMVTQRLLYRNISYCSERLRLDGLGAKLMHRAMKDNPNLRPLYQVLEIFSSWGGRGYGEE